MYIRRHPVIFMLPSAILFILCCFNKLQVERKEQHRQLYSSEQIMISHYIQSNAKITIKNVQSHACKHITNGKLNTYI